MIIASDYENIEVDEDKNLILTPAQHIALADYIEGLETRVKKLESQLEQANNELKKAYKDDNSIDLTKFDGILTGAGIATLLVILAGNI